MSDTDSHTKLTTPDSMTDSWEKLFAACDEVLLIYAPYYAPKEVASAWRCAKKLCRPEFLKGFHLEQRV